MTVVISMFSIDLYPFQLRADRLAKEFMHTCLKLKVLESGSVTSRKAWGWSNSFKN